MSILQGSNQGMLLNLIKTSTVETVAFNQAANSTAVDVSGCSLLAFQVVATVSTPANKAFASTDVDTAADTVTITAHGFTTGLKVQLTTSGALPTGLSTSTDYFIIAVNANTIAFATSLVNANAGTKINITAAGSGNSSVNPVALAGATATLNKSVDGTNWAAEGSPVSISSTGALAPFEKVDPTANYYRIAFAITAGSVSATVFVLGKGLV